MKFLRSLLTVLVLISCSSKETTWDAGAQKQQDYQGQAKQEQQEKIRSQFPGGREY